MPLRIVSERGGNNGLLPALLISAILLIITCAGFTAPTVTGDAGICFPSPNQWQLPRLAGWLTGVCVLLTAVLLLSQINRKFNIVSSTDSLLPAILLTATCACPPVTFTVSTSTLLLAANVICLYFIFETFEKSNASQQFFSIATFISLGALVQYAFLMMVPVYLAAGFAMKSLRLRELLAFGFGLVAPFWIVAGLGIVSPVNFRFPETLHNITASSFDTELLVMIVMTGIMALVALLLSLYNGIRIFTRNSRTRAMHFSLNALGVMALICMLLDFTNFSAYYGLISLWFAVETATALSLDRIRNPMGWYLALVILFLTAYIFII